MNKKGLTLVEIIVSIGLISIVMVFLFQIIMTNKKANDRQNEKTDVLITTTIITREVEKDLESFGLAKDKNNNLPIKPEICKEEDIGNIEDTRNNIVPNTAKNIKCLKIIYDDLKVKNNEGYILYYENSDNKNNDNKNNYKYFLAYKRGKGNVIETQTVREISIPPKNDFVSEIINYDESQGKGYSLNIKMIIQNDNIKSDLNINYAVSVSHKITIINKDGYLKNKELELIRQTGELVTINLDFNEYLYQKNISCNKCVINELDNKKIEFTMPDEDVILNVSITERPIELTKYLIGIICEKPDAKNLLGSMCNEYSYSLTGNPLADDIGLVTDPFKNIRFRGASPSNYITFNNEKWRIIGVFNVTTIDKDGKEKPESLVKIVRDEPFSDQARWNDANINNWKESSLQKNLNEPFYNKIENKNLIANVEWGLGGIKSLVNKSDSFYKIERNIGGFTGTKNNPQTWTGKIGLIYPSDYGYASTDSNCLDSTLNNNKCYNQNWLYKTYNNSTKINYWTITHYSKDDNAKNALYIDQINKKINSNVSTTDLYVYPSLYLKSDTKILRSEGDGTKDKPYKIYLENNE